MKKVKKKNIYRIRLLGIGLITVLALFIALSVDSIEQDLSYHNLADQRTLLAIPNFWNIFSNLPFIIVGFFGIIYTVKKRFVVSNRQSYTMYFTFFLGVLLTGIGSGYYHLEPNNYTLVWDRIPMAIAFMSLFSIIVLEHINEKLGHSLFLPLLLLGIGSVLYWHWTEKAGMGDLRFYAIVQFLPLLLIPYILLNFNSIFTRNHDIYLVLFFYFLAKIAEYFDSELYELLSVSGHTLKHILAAFGSYLVLRMVILRKKVDHST